MQTFSKNRFFVSVFICLFTLKTYQTCQLFGIYKGTFDYTLHVKVVSSLYSPGEKKVEKIHPGCATADTCCSGWAVFAQVAARLHVLVPGFIYFRLLPEYCMYVFSACQNLTLKKKRYDFLKNAISALNIGFFSSINILPIFEYFPFVRFLWNLAWRFI